MGKCMKDRKWPILSQISGASGKTYTMYYVSFRCLSSCILIEMHLFKPSAVGKSNYISALFANLSDLFPIKLCLKGVLDKIPQMTQFPLFSPNDNI